MDHAADQANPRGNRKLVPDAKELIAKADRVLGTYRDNPHVAGAPNLDTGAFAGWRSQCLTFLTQLLGSAHPYVISFDKDSAKAYRAHAEAGREIIRAVLEDLEQNSLCTEPSHADDAIFNIQRLIARFHGVARQLRSRHARRSTLDVQDEYDVQDLVHALLRTCFDDVRAEEWTPSYAGKASRVDFLLKAERIVIETKMTREGLGAKQVGEQLVQDIARYRSHPGCATLVCFVYDPIGRVANPRGIEADLSKIDDDLRVLVVIRP